jgi:hypothetical protein
MHDVDLAVQLGLDPTMGMEGQDCFPFIYTLVNKDNDQWAPVSGSTIPSLSHITPNGIPIAPGQKVSYPVLLDPDHNYKLLSIKYQAYGVNPPPRHPPAGYSAWTNLNDVYSAGLDPDAQKIGEPFYGFLGITIYMMSSGARTLYGGIDASSGLPKSGQIVPLPLRPMQSGPDHGFLSMRTPYLLSRAGTLIFEVTNNHPSISLFPSALIYGIKVRI